MNFPLSEQTEKHTPPRKKRSLSLGESPLTQSRAAFFQELQLERELADLSQGMQDLIVEKETDGKNKKVHSSHRCSLKK